MLSLASSMPEHGNKKHNNIRQLLWFRAAPKGHPAGFSRQDWPLLAVPAGHSTENRGFGRRTFPAVENCNQTYPYVATDRERRSLGGKRCFGHTSPPCFLCCFRAAVWVPHSTPANRTAALPRRATLIAGRSPDNERRTPPTMDMATTCKSGFMRAAMPIASSGKKKRRADAQSRAVRRIFSLFSAAKRGAVRRGKCCTFASLTKREIHGNDGHGE